MFKLAMTEDSLGIKMGGGVRKTQEQNQLLRLPELSNPEPRTRIRRLEFYPQPCHQCTVTLVTHKVTHNVRYRLKLWCLLFI